jgi:hypothetical protein
MPSRPATTSPGLSIWTAGLLAAVAIFVLWDSVVRGRHVLAVSENYGVAVDAPAPSVNEASGYQDGRRSLVLPAGASDTAHWIMQTQAMMAAGDWRVRWVDYDNAPTGREVHWAAPLHWWLGGLAWADHWISGRPLGISVERAVIYSGPLMFLLLLAGLGPFLLRRFSALAAIVFALGAVAVYPFYLDFVAIYADHHGLANICGLLTVLFFAAGSGNPAEARRWLTASALAGGTGLWISAATQVPVLVALGLGMLAAIPLARGRPAGMSWLADPGLLRIWGWSGGAMSLAAWVLEYFPHHLGLRLEVNHPLYAFAWVGAGEALRVAALAGRDGARGVSGPDRLRAALGVGLLILLPAVIAITKAKTFVVADPFVWRIHALYISEFQGLWRILGRGLTWTAVGLCLPLLLLAPALVRALRPSIAPEERAQLVLVLVPAIFAWLMGWNQVRWLSLAYALTVPVLAVFFRMGEASRTRAAFFGWLGATALLFSPGLWQAAQRTRAGADFTADDIRNLAERDVAHWLRLRGGSDPVIVLASPNPTSHLVYHGGLRGVDTLYWENVSGLRNAAAFYGAASSDEARAIVTRLGITHIVFTSWGAFEGTFALLQRGLPVDAPVPADAFAAQLLHSPVPPPWLRLVPFKLPAHPSLAGEEVRIWEVVPDQAPAAALARAANYYLELGRVEDAEKLAPALVNHADELPDLVMLAGIASRAHDADGFAAVFGQLLTELPHAGSLALDERIHLVVVLAVGQKLDLARTQLRQAMSQLDERGVRHLTSGERTDLLALSDALGVAWPTAELARLAQSLIPPDQRK